MMKKLVLLFIFLIPFFASAQSEKFPEFPECVEKGIEAAKQCFYNTTKELFFKEFKEPSIIKEEKYRGNVNAVFVVSNTGNFKLIYVNSPYKELKEEVERVFKTFPKITPAKYNNNDVEMRFALPINFPLNNNDTLVEEIVEVKKEEEKVVVKNTPTKKTIFKEHQSQLNIPFVHQNYIDYEYALNKAKNTHSAVKPYVYDDVNLHYDLDAEKTKFLKPNKTTFFGKKLWNEHLLQVRGEDYWINLDFLLDVQLGKDNSNLSSTFNNSRVLTANGGIGEKFFFSASIFESQGRYADYVNDYISNRSDTFKPAFSEGLIPGRGKAKGFGEDSFDYPVAEGYLAYKPNKFLQVQLGNGKHFIGDGYRSMLLSDVSSPMPYIKMSVNFWKLNFTNIWLWGTDVRAPVVVNNAHARKYIAIHYLSINITDKLNIGVFESAVSRGDDGFDFGYLNPIIFYRSIEFSKGEDAGNALLGLTAKYKLKDNLVLYSQFILDDLSLNEIDNLGYWANKYGYQIGAKYFDAFNVKNLFLQGEFNTARPYTYSHRDPVLNYGNYSQSLGHAWGGNFWEAIGIANYKLNRWTASAKVIYGKKGFDDSPTINYGGDIYKSYDTRWRDNDNETAQGDVATIFLADFQGRYLVNPTNNLSLFGGVTFRQFKPDTPTATLPENNTVWISLGVKVDLFNWYFDF